MLVMVRLRGMRLLSSLLVLCVLLSGCSMDIMRPDLFHDADMMAYPSWIDGTGSSDEGSDGEEMVKPGTAVEVWPNGSPSNKEYEYKPSTSTDNTDDFAAITADTIQCRDYVTYLQEHVYADLKEIINVLPADTRSNLYLRVGHTGYSIDANGQLRRDSGWQESLVGSSVQSERVVGGDTLMLLATDWLGSLPGNSDHVKLQVERAQQEITKSVSADAMSKDFHAMQDAGLPQIYRNLMGRDGADFKTLQEYYDAIATDPYHNIPNFSLQIRTGEATTDTVIFNKTSPSVATPYTPGASFDTVDKMFRIQNQYSTRERTPVDECKQDESSLCRYYLDGYNKTVIFIGCTDGEDLIDTVGEDTYRKMLSVVSNAYSCTDVSSIKSLPQENEYDDVTQVLIKEGTDYSKFSPISAGSKGVD